MRKDRFFVPADYHGEVLGWTDKDLSHQLKKVLRLENSDEIYLFNDQGEEARVCVLSNDNSNLKFKILEVRSPKENITEVTLYASLLKKDNFELVIQKATEAGISAIVPVLTERTVKQGERLDRWRLIIKEAAEQSGRLRLPKIFLPLSFTSALKTAQEKNSVNLICDLTGRSFDQKFSGPLGLFVGPEGGFTAEELSLAESQGCLKVKLGDFVLRAETAALVATFIVAGGWTQQQ